MKKEMLSEYRAGMFTIPYEAENVARQATTREQSPVKNENCKQELIAVINDLLDHAGEGLLSPSPYDTAWVARIADEKDDTKPLFPQCLQWLLQHQNSDGSWGSDRQPGYYYDKVICTLSAIVCLQQWQNKGMDVGSYVARGVEYVNNTMPPLEGNQYRTVGFELLFPALIREALDLNINLEVDDRINNILLLQEKKLKKINGGLLFEKRTPLLHSLEGIPLQAINWEKLMAYQGKDGSFQASCAVTAFVYLHTRNPLCLEYLQKVWNRYQYIPVGYPLDIFEAAWCLEIIARLELRSSFGVVYERKLEWLKKQWNNNTGVGWTTSFNDLPDLDDTSVVYYLLSRQNLQPDPGVFDNFYSGNRIFCLPAELDSSPTHLFHLLLAYNGNNSELQNTAWQQAIALLNGEWTDKWHLSPYYLTSIAITPLFRSKQYDIANILRFIMERQNPDGGWGTPSSNAEETGWACMTLLVYLTDSNDNTNTSIIQCLSRGIRFLEAVKISPGADVFPDLWLEKCLYTPYTIVYTLINAVMLKFYQSY